MSLAWLARWCCNVCILRMHKLWLGSQCLSVGISCHGSSRGSGTGRTGVKDSDVDVGESSDSDGARSMKK